MTPTVSQIPLRASIAGFRPLSVSEYNHLTEIGLLTERDHVELLEGMMVNKMARGTLHDSRMYGLARRMTQLIPPEWDVRVQTAVLLGDSVPEPDIGVVRFDPNYYAAHHPMPADIGLVVEVAVTSLESDRQDKCRIYARAGIVRYWIVNLPDRQIEVYEEPSGLTAAPAYAKRTDYRPGDQLPFILDGVPIATLPAQDLLG